MRGRGGGGAAGPQRGRSAPKVRVDPPRRTRDRNDDDDRRAAGERSPAPRAVVPRARVPSLLLPSPRNAEAPAGGGHHQDQERELELRDEAEEGDLVDEQGNIVGDRHNIVGDRHRVSRRSGVRIRDFVDPFEVDPSAVSFVT